MFYFEKENIIAVNCRWTFPPAFPFFICHNFLRVLWIYLRKSIFWKNNDDDDDDDSEDEVTTMPIQFFFSI